MKRIISLLILLLLVLGTFTNVAAAEDAVEVQVTSVSYTHLFLASLT